MKLSDIQNSFLDSVFDEDKSLDYILPTHSNAEDTIEIYKSSINAQLINTLKVVYYIIFGGICYLNMIEDPRIGKWFGFMK